MVLQVGLSMIRRILSWLLRTTLVVVVVAMVGVKLSDQWLAGSVYSGPPSEHFDGQVFLNEKDDDSTFFELGRVMWEGLRLSARWPDWVDSQPGVVPEVTEANPAWVTFINHATVLIQVDGVNILTDPVYSKRTSPSRLIGPKRVRDPGIHLHDLPPIDYILISHNHYDHLDLRTLQRIQQRQPLGRPLHVVAGLGNGPMLKEAGIEHVHELDWGDHVEHEGVRMVFTPSQHRSGRWVSDQMRTLWGAFVIESSLGPIYFAGDTGYASHFKAAGDEYGPFVLSLLPIGAYEPRWFMGTFHLNPKEAVQAHLDLRSQRSIGVHYGTFQLTYEGIEQPLIDLAAAREAAGLHARDFGTLAFGGSEGISPLE